MQTTESLEHRFAMLSFTYKCRVFDAPVYYKFPRPNVEIYVHAIKTGYYVIDCTNAMGLQSHFVERSFEAMEQRVTEYADQNR